MADPVESQSARDADRRNAAEVLSPEPPSNFAVFMHPPSDGAWGMDEECLEGDHQCWMTRHPQLSSSACPCWCHDPEPKIPTVVAAAQERVREAKEQLRQARVDLYRAMWAGMAGEEGQRQVAEAMRERAEASAAGRDAS